MYNNWIRKLSYNGFDYLELRKKNKEGFNELISIINYCFDGINIVPPEIGDKTPMKGMDYSFTLYEITYHQNKKEHFISLSPLDMTPANTENSKKVACITFNRNLKKIIAEVSISDVNAETICQEKFEYNESLDKKLKYNKKYYKKNYNNDTDLDFISPGYLINIKRFSDMPTTLTKGYDLDYSSFNGDCTYVDNTLPLSIIAIQNMDNCSLNLQHSFQKKIKESFK